MADAAETVKKTVEQTTARAKAQAENIQAAGAKAFREGVDKSVASLTELNAQGKKNLEAVVESAAAAQKGAEALSHEALAFSQEELGRRRRRRPVAEPGALGAGTGRTADLVGQVGRRGLSGRSSARRPRSSPPR